MIRFFFDQCETCSSETETNKLIEARDFSDGNIYLMCPVCRQKNNKLFQEEVEDYIEYD